MVEGKSITLQWTYDAGGSAFRQAELDADGVPFVIDRLRQEPIAINPAFVGRVTANISETNASITFLAVYRNDSKSYQFIVQNEGRLADTRALDIEVHCEYS